MRVFMTATVCGAMVCSILSAQVEPKNEPFVAKVQKKSA